MNIRQPDLFGPPAPYRGDPPAQAHSPTSQAAAKSIKKSIGPLHQKIIDHLKSVSGETRLTRSNRLAVVWVLA